MNQRIELTLRGNLQGIGLRPFLWRLAQSLSIEGSVSNTPDGVVILAQGPYESLQAFQQQVLTSPPDFARIDSIQVRFRPLNTTIKGFSIAESIVEPTPAHAIAHYAIPDLPPCQSCIAELLDPNHRRFMDPMISCTQCGPRYSIQFSSPFDRCRTSMAPYSLCNHCKQEYQDPSDRRFHSQTISCFQCGPSWNWTTNCSSTVVGLDAPSIQRILREIMQCLLEGKLILAKAVGGYQFLCDPCSPEAIQALRDLKQRPTKPFALLVDSLESALALVDLSPTGRSLLTSPERPIVIAHRETSTFDQRISIHSHLHQSTLSSIAPNLNPIDATLGVMLPNSPMQLLLLQSLKELRPLPAILVTSANQSNAPMLIDDNTAFSSYADAVAGVLSHSRQITQPLDDSVWIDISQRFVPTLSKSIPVRRARGASPMRFPIANSSTTYASSKPFVSSDSPQSSNHSEHCIALGGDLKATLSCSSSNYICCTQHLGDASDPEVLRVIREKITRELLAHQPRSLKILADDHPGYHTHQLARELQDQAIFSTIPHHFAHLASLACDHQLPSNEPFLSFVFDGTGYGIDESIWGGELLMYRPKHDSARLDHPLDNARTNTLCRIGHLRTVPLPRSDVAGKHPWRCALAYLQSINEDPVVWLPPFRALSDQEQTILRQHSQKKGHSIPSSSIGRLIDAVASILDLVHDNEFEAHAAMRLEQEAWTHFHALQVQGRNPICFEDRYCFPAVWQDDNLLFDYSVPLIDILKDINEQLPVNTIAYRFHGALLDMILNGLKGLSEVETCRSESKAEFNLQFSFPAKKTIGCTGGVFQNALLVAALEYHLPSHGWQLLTHRQIPPNDAGISIGQAWISSAR